MTIYLDFRKIYCILINNWKKRKSNYTDTNNDTDTQHLKIENWKLETGDWKLGLGNRKLETGTWKLETGNWDSLQSVYTFWYLLSIDKR